ncbi:MAG: LysR family transcriptional regulator [Burkholderiales bacterium]|nr:LysR family transcriptional regulator [Burkholderiales bacterium]
MAERNVSRAAHKLFLSQPATSALLARLRDVFNDPLLVRSGRGMVPTERALTLVEPVRKVLGDIRDILQPQEAFDPRTSTRTFTIAGTEYVGLAVMPQLTRQLQQHAPQVRIALVAPTHETMAQQMEAGVLDLAVVNQSLVQPQLRSSRFLTDEFCVIARKNHPRIKKRLSLDVFCRLPHVMVSPRTGSFSAQTDEALKTMKLQRFVQLSVPYFTLAAEAVAHSDMIAVYPTRLAALADPRLQVLKAPLALPSFTLKACWHERAQNEAAHQWLRQMLASCLI